MNRAITSAIFLAALLGCNPELSREAGGLVVYATAVPSEATTLEVSIVAGQTSSTHQAPIDGPTGTLSVESVPAGMAEVVARLLDASSARLAEQTGSTEIVADQVRELTFSFGAALPDAGVFSDGGADEIVSAPIASTISSIRETDISGTTLSARDDINTAAFSAFIASARTRFGNDPGEIVVQSARIELVPPPISDVDRLEAILSDAVVFIRGRDSTVEVDVAQAPSISGTTVDLSTLGDQSGLATLLVELLAARVEVGVRGTTPKTSSDRFSADLQISLVFRALP